MVTIDYTGLRLTGALRINRLTALELHVGVNEHGWAVVEGEAGENALEQLQGAVAGREQVIMVRDESGVEQPLFAGVIRTAGLITYGGYNRFRIELQSGTIQMDQVKRSRSFQDVAQTYSQVAQRVASGYEDGAVIPTVGLDKPLGVPVIQYRETDWEFLKRMASWCGGVVVPETHYAYPRIWFGFPERAFTCTFPEDCYTSGISQRYYELGGPTAGNRRADFFYYDVPSSQMCDLGWYIVFRGQEFLICEKWAKLERGELLFTYRLGKPGLGCGRKQYNDKISGMTILGEVLSTKRETVCLKLDIDEGWAPGGPYPYTWRPETGNMMYCMPQVGTRVSLYFPNYDEQAAIAVNCVRTNGSSCARMSDPSKRSFVTEHGKEMNLYPQELSFLGGANGTVKLEDETGITISTDKKIRIVAQQTVQVNGQTVTVSAPAGELVLAKGNALSGSIESSVTQSGQYDLIAATNTCMEGWNQQTFEACDGAPQEGSFDWGGLIGNVLAGIAVAAVVGLAAAAVVATGGLAALGVAATAANITAAGFGAFLGGVISVGFVASEDIADGTVSSKGTYVTKALCGAISGAVSAFFGPALFKNVSAFEYISKATIVGVGSGAAGGLTEWLITSLFDVGYHYTICEAFTNAIYSGIGGFIGGSISQVFGTVAQRTAQNVASNSLGNIKSIIRDYLSKQGIHSNAAAVRLLNKIYGRSLTSINSFKSVVRDNPLPLLENVTREMFPIVVKNNLQESLGGIAVQVVTTIIQNLDDINASSEEHTSDLETDTVEDIEE